MARNPLTHEARKYIGTKYVLGGTTRSGIDCSGLVLEVALAVTGRVLSRTADEQMKDPGLVFVKPEGIQRGDFLFYHKVGGVVQHVAIATRPGYVIDAEGGTEVHDGVTIPGGVEIRPRAAGYYVGDANLVAIRRLPVSKLQALPYWMRNP